jgi:hypothetical protein
MQLVELQFEQHARERLRRLDHHLGGGHGRNAGEGEPCGQGRHGPRRLAGRRLRQGCLRGRGRQRRPHVAGRKPLGVAQCKFYGIDAEDLRKRIQGTNAGCKHPEVLWQDALVAYKAGKKARAYFLVGCLLHQIQDQGVPAHANFIEHQGNPIQFDNFEFNATFNPSYITNGFPDYRLQVDTSRVNRKDPQYAFPYQYYEFSRDWAATDAPGYKDRSKYSKTRLWPFFTDAEKNLMMDRQTRTYQVTVWTMQCVARGFAQ